MSDISQSVLYSRADARYQSVLFNGELWGYDELIARFANTFYTFAYWHSNWLSTRVFWSNSMSTGQRT